jgi:hypothetical protein
MSGLDLHHRAAALGSGAQQKEHHDPIAAFEELLRFSKHLLERLKKVLECPPGFLAAATCLGNGTPIRRLQLEVRVRLAKDGIPVPSTDRLVLGAKRLNVCL